MASALHEEVPVAEDDDASPATSPPQRSLLDPQVLRYTGLLLVTRLATVALVLAGLEWLTWDPSRDLILHAFLSERPVEHLTDPFLPQYPPFLGLAETITYHPWRWLGVSHATSVRLGAVVWDVVAGWFVLSTVALLRRDRVRWVAVAYLVMPATWVASAAFGQDEMIGAALVAATLWALARGQWGAARVVAVAALFVAKILLAPVLLALVVTSRRPGREAALIGGQVAAWMAVLWATTGSNGLTNQTSYKPEWVEFSITPWGWLVSHDHVSWQTSHVVGPVLAAVVATALLWLCVQRRGALPDVDQVAVITTAILLAAFSMLAIVNPEYIALVVPALLVVAARAPSVAWIGAIATLPWATDTAFALIRRSDPRDWPVIGEIRPGTGGYDLVSWIHLALSVTTGAVFLVFAYRVVTAMARPPVTASAEE